ncbi:MAG: hypothetical protein LC754_08775, partial [Acidobacteria bacterium]|nr:hypothetical protein [Acidobacteriota bacterium]
MKRLTLNAILACVALAAAVMSASAQTGESVKIKFSEKQIDPNMPGPATQSMEGVVLNGRPYVALSELSRAVSGKDTSGSKSGYDGDTLATGFKVDGDT